MVFHSWFYITYLFNFPSFRFLAMSAAAVNTTSDEEFKAVSQESCNTPKIRPTATTCIAISFDIPNKLQATGINISEPPATPDAPAADTAEIHTKMMAVNMSTSIPKVKTVARVSTEIVIAAPAIFMVAPKGMDTE